MNIFVFFVFTILGSQFSEAAESVGTSIHQFYQAPRALGMGGAFVAVANDYSALFYNPAGLDRIDENDLNMYLDVAGTPAVSDLLKDIDTAQNTKGSDSEKQAAVAKVLESYYGKNFGIRVGLPQAIWARPGWAIGIIPMDLTAEFSVHNSVGPAVQATVYADTTVAYGYGSHFKGSDFGKLSWGITGKAVHRGFFSQNVNFIELATDPNIVSADDLSSGYTVDADVGFLWSPSIPDDGFFSVFDYARPTFGLVVRNVAETGFTKSGSLGKNSTETPEKLYRVLDIGSRWEYPSVWIFGGRGVLDIRDINHPRFSLRKGLHAGFEFDWSVASWWKGQYRFGINQGFWTAGVSAMFTIFNLDLVSYADDIGSFSTPKENRVWMLRTSLNF
jgi:hypothetical protein